MPHHPTPRVPASNPELALYVLLRSGLDSRLAPGRFTGRLSRPPPSFWAKPSKAAAAPGALPGPTYVTRLNELPGWRRMRNGLHLHPHATRNPQSAPAGLSAGPDLLFPLAAQRRAAASRETESESGTSTSHRGDHNIESSGALTCDRPSFTSS